MSLLESSYENMMTEIGWIWILTPFQVRSPLSSPSLTSLLTLAQRSHVLTHACGLLMGYILDSTEQGGLGLRRCQWKANSLNKKSHAAALRLGFEYEGTMRAWIVTPEGKISIHGELCGWRSRGFGAV